MRTLVATTQKELDKILKENKDGNFNLYLRGLKKIINLDLSGLKLKGYLNLKNAKIWGNLNLENAEIGGSLNIRNAEIDGNLYLHNAKIWGNIIANYTQKDINFLKSLPLGIIDLKTWQSNENWLEAETMNDLHTCGTTYCVRGYAEAQYYVKHGKKVEDAKTLYPNLKHLFHMSNEQFLKERQNIIN